jgi:hypothetical protein
MIGTEQRSVRIRVVREFAAAQDRVDPEALWLDLDVAPEELIRLDPLDITCDMVDMAEQPELADFTMRNLRPRNCSLRALERWRRTRRKGSGKRESPKDFVARLRGGGPAEAPFPHISDREIPRRNLWSWVRFSGSGTGKPEVASVAN